jgi:hypothetical protein
MWPGSGADRATPGHTRQWAGHEPRVTARHWWCRSPASLRSSVKAQSQSLRVSGSPSRAPVSGWLRRFLTPRSLAGPPTGRSTKRRGAAHAPLRRAVGHRAARSTTSQPRPAMPRSCQRRQPWGLSSHPARYTTQDVVPWVAHTPSELQRGGSNTVFFNSTSRKEQQVASDNGKRPAPKGSHRRVGTSGPVCALIWRP